MKIFISHASRDEHQAADLETWLLEHHLAPVRVPRGKRQEQTADPAVLAESERQLATCAAFVHVVTPFWHASKLCAGERAAAAAADKPAFALIAAPTPGAKLDDMREKFDLGFDRKTAFAGLATALRAVAGGDETSVALPAAATPEPTPQTAAVSPADISKSADKTVAPEVVPVPEEASPAADPSRQAPEKKENEAAGVAPAFEKRIQMSIDEARAAMHTKSVPDWLAWAIQSPITWRRPTEEVDAVGGPAESEPGRKRGFAWLPHLDRSKSLAGPHFARLRAPLDWLRADKKRVFGALAGGLAVLLGLGWLAFADRFGEEARIRRELQSVKSRQAVFLSRLSSRLLAEGDKEAALQLGLEAVEQAGTSQDSLDARVSLYTALMANAPPPVFTGHGNHVSDVAFSPDGKRLVSASWDETVRVWDVETGRQTLVLEGFDSLVNSAVFSPDQKQILIATVDGKARLFDAASGKPLGVFDGHLDDLADAAFSPDGKRMATASADRTAQLWDVATKKPLVTFRGHKAGVESVAFNADGSRLVTASADDTANIYDLSSEQPLAVLSGHKGPVRDARFAPSGGYVATASEDKTARLWNAYTGSLVRSFAGHQWGVLSVAFSPDGRRLVTGSKDNTARVWDVATGATALVLKGHAGIVTKAVFSPDQQWIATASGDKTVRLWPLPKNTAALVAKARAAVSTCMSPEQRRKYFLDAAPPAWCIEMKKQPYDSDRWRAWLKDVKAGRHPSLPKSAKDAS